LACCSGAFFPQPSNTTAAHIKNIRFMPIAYARVMAGQTLIAAGLCLRGISADSGA